MRENEATELGLANGTILELIRVELDPREPAVNPVAETVFLSYLPVSLIFKKPKSKLPRALPRLV